MRTDRLLKTVWALAAAIVMPQVNVQAESVTWVNSGGGSWHTPSNWSSNPNLPGPNDDVTIDVPASPTVTIGDTGTDVSVRSLSSTEALRLMNGTLTVGVGGGTLSGPISVERIPDRFVNLATREGDVVVTGLTNLDGGSVQVYGGGTMMLPNFIAWQDPYQNGLQANDAGSVLDVSRLTSLTPAMSSNTTAIAARSGGRVDISALRTVNSGSSVFIADGVDSAVDLSAFENYLTGAVTGSARGFLTATHGGRLITPNLTNIGPVDVTVEGIGSTIDASQLATANGASFHAFLGATLALPNVTRYTGRAGRETVIETRDAGSVIDFPSLTMLSAGEASSVRISAGTGGQINLPSLVGIEVAGGVQLGNVTASGGGRILMPSLVTIGAVGMRLGDSSAHIETPQLATALGTSFYADGGASLTFPALRSFGLPLGRTSTIHAGGNGSIVDLSFVTEFTGGNNSSTVAVEALSGGRIHLSRVVALTQGTATILASGIGVVVDLSSLSEFLPTGTGNSKLRAENGGRIVTPSLTRLGRVTVEVDGPSSIVDLRGVTEVINSNIQALNRSRLSLPALTSITTGMNKGARFAAGGFGSVIDLSALTEVIGQPSAGSMDGFTVSTGNGGRIDLRNLRTLTGQLLLEASGIGASIDLSSLEHIDGAGQFAALFANPDGGSLILNQTEAVSVERAKLWIYRGSSITGHRLDLGVGAELGGAGAFVGDVVNLSGTIRPFAAFGSLTGQLSITGTFEQRSQGTLYLTGGNHLRTGPAALGGTLDIGDGVPPDSCIELMSFPSRVGTFDAVVSRSTVTNYVSYTPTGIVVCRPATDRLGDLDHDSLIGRKDVALLAQNFGRTTGAMRDHGDLDSDGRVSMFDLAIFQPLLTADLTVAATASPMVVPEPSAVLMLLALFWLLAARRGRFRYQTAFQRI